MSASVANASKADPNLTPMLDMVFQLITFFMLVINFKAASIDRNVQLPLIGSAQPVGLGSEADVLVLNVTAAGDLRVGGQTQQTDEFLLAEAQAGLAKAQQLAPDGAPLKLGDDLPTTVVVRADKSVPFTQVNRVLMACQRVGFRKISLKALERPTSEPLRQ